MEEKRKPIPWFWWTVAGLMMLVAYPLSMGPILRLVSDGYLPKEMRAIYRPLGWVIERSPPPVQRVLLWSAFYCHKPIVERQF